ncbi:hypothetical protein TNCV_3299351 [Trichonephila clavipes]|uniref:Uncharacterized protein n=1 Tax=Trichonephila clavipes TaxID=2585209 RepID=A0A8X7B8J8_TRICX|nr:hypothetical protein TNCV_3299351 [Trichonephila clavipes]
MHCDCCEVQGLVLCLVLQGQESYVRLFRGAVDPDFIFMDDKVKPDRAHMVEEFLDIRRRDWPARSPELNPKNMPGTLWRGQLQLAKPLRETSKA